MYYQVAVRSNKKIANHYLVKDIMESTQQQLIIKIYDFAILQCQKRNLIKTNEAIQKLINALNFKDEKAKEISNGLFKLYMYCQDQMRKKNYDAVYKVLTELRESWLRAFNMQR